uniref:Uncharacterized protein n=1 Tax=Anopheles stephensi TaxID=30069 RepID=A0A182Y3Z7_ANOST
MRSMQITVVVCLWCVGVLSVVDGALYDDGKDSSCTQLDFDETTLSSLKECDYMQEFIVKRYDESTHFDPYRPEAVHYLSHRWQGLTCGETVHTYSFNEETELRMAYNLVFDSGATLEVRVFDEDRRDTDNRPTLVEVWHTTSSTNGWGYFREKLNKTVKQARIQIEANINAGSDLAIEYLTIFNYEVETEECSVIDEFATTTVAPATTETTTIAAETTTQQPATTTTLAPAMTSSTTETFPSTTVSTADEGTTTEASDEPSTSTLAQTTEMISTTTTNAPRDDTSMPPSTSTTRQPTSSYFTTDSSNPSTTAESTAPILEPLSPKQWLWMTLTAVFAILFVLAASAAIYLCFINQHLERISARLLDEVGRYPGKKDLLT